jgi:hypothetical protein
MKDRLFRRRDVERNVAREDATNLDARAGGPAWDRPDDDEEFAPPLREDDLHWAFRPPASERAPDGQRRPPPAASRHWAFREPHDTADDVFDRGWTPEDGARLVTAAPREAEASPRDPAQPGIFDPYDSFAPTTDEPWWGSTPPEERATAASDTAVAAAPTRSAERPPVEEAAHPDSVFGDLFMARADGKQTGIPRATPDPREWPPIPGTLLPSVPQSLAESGTAEPDGRRFTWPPPQPRVAPPSTSQPPERAAASAAGQASLWRTADEAAAEPAVRARQPAHGFSEAARSEPGRQVPPEEGAGTSPVNRTIMTVVLTVAIALALVLLFARFVAPLLA